MKVTHRNKYITLLLAVVMSGAVHARSFRGEGSDLMMGIGADAIARSGAVAASTSDIYSMYWNPAGLAQMEQNQVTLSGQLDAQLTGFNFAALAFNNKRLRFGRYQAAIGMARLTRLHVKASGAYGPDDFESIFLRYALPGLPDDFDGDIESKTRDTRITIALRPLADARWSLGINFGEIHCKTSFCGVFATDPGNFTVASTDAKAQTLGIGGKYQVNDQLILGLNIKDIDTDLDVETIQTDANGTTIKRFTTGFPRSITVAAFWKHRFNKDITLEYENVSGDYGTSEVDIQVIRGGYEYRQDQWSYRAGILIPLVIESDSVQDIKSDLPAPFLISAGVGWGNRQSAIDFALYPHPLMSYSKGRLSMSAEMSITYRF